MNPAGDTAVHVASAQGYDAVLRVLAERGADLNVRNKRGLTPLGALVGRGNAKNADTSARSTREDTIALLRSLGARE